MAAKLDIFDFADYQEFLLEIYRQRKLKNNAYSLRAFSRSLGMKDQAIGNVVNGRYGLSAETAEIISKHLELNSEETNYFLTLVEGKHARSSAAKRKASKLATEIRASFQGVEKFEEHEAFILEKWYTPAVLEMITMNSESSNLTSVARRLGVSSHQVQESLNVLVANNFLAQAADGRYVRTVQASMSQSQTPSPIIRNFHKQVLSKAIESIDRDAGEKRKSLSSVFSFHLNDLAEAREELQKFHASFLKKFSVSDNCDSVFSVSLQLFRMDESETSAPSMEGQS